MMRQQLTKETNQMVTTKQKNWAYFLIGGLLALVIAIGIGSVLAQTNDEATPTPETEETTPDGDETEAIPGFGRRGFGRFGGDSEALAEALGITVEELDAAKQEAREAAIAQAVADGLLTQEQADQLLASDFGGRGWHFGGDQDTYLAEALGISVEELAAARDQVFADQLAVMVEAGMLTQEQADLALARHAVQSRLDTDALQAAVQSAYEDAVAQALADGIITQEQADQLLSELNAQSFGFRGFGFGGHHGPGRGPGFGFGNGIAPNTGTAPSTTDTNSDL
jgi:formaldehyde-activating enzyme involved in methanogenesis